MLYASCARDACKTLEAFDTYNRDTRPLRQSSNDGSDALLHPHKTHLGRYQRHIIVRGSQSLRCSRIIILTKIKMTTIDILLMTKNKKFII